MPNVCLRCQVLETPASQRRSRGGEWRETVPYERFLATRARGDRPRTHERGGPKPAPLTRVRRRRPGGAPPLAGLAVSP